MAERPFSLSADKPLYSPDQDLLGYAPFGKHLAESLIKMAPAEGFVVAIYGAWGSGKSSLLNLLIHFLEYHE